LEPTTWTEKVSKVSFTNLASHIKISPAPPSTIPSACISGPVALEKPCTLPAPITDENISNTVTPANLSFDDYLFRVEAVIARDNAAKYDYIGATNFEFKNMWSTSKNPTAEAKIGNDSNGGSSAKKSGFFAPWDTIDKI
jgi:hypothetical protein